MHRSRLRLAPLALAAALALGACGGGDDGSAADTVPAADSGDASATDGGLLAPRAVRTSGGGAAMSAAAEAAPAAGGKMASDMMMPYRITTFVAGEGLELPTNAIGYGFEAGATVTAEQVAALAAALGVTGEPVRTDDGYSVSWRVGPDDGTAPSLWVYQDAQLSWNYSSAWADQTAVATSCAVAEPGVAVDAAGGAAAGDVAVAPTPESTVPVPPECAAPEPPANVPSKEDAEAKAREVMAAVGLDPAGFRFDTYADEWFASTSAVEQLGDVSGGRTFSAGFGGEGVLQYASGQLAEPVQAGPYPLVDLGTAVARLNDPSGFYGGFGMALGAPDMARVDVAVAEEATAIAPAAGGAAGAPASTMLPVTPLPGDVPQTTVPAPEEVTVTLVSVEADVWWAYDVDGSVWLLPAYRFTGDDGGTYTVPAVTDEFLVQVPAEAVPVPEPMPLPVETVTAGVPTESVPEDAMELFDTSVLEPSVGKTLADFTADAEALGASVRVTEIAGVPQAVTMDYSTSRVNVAVDGEGDAATVTAILNVG